MNLQFAYLIRLYSRVSALLASVLGFTLAILMTPSLAAAQKPLDPRIHEVKTILIRENVKLSTLTGILSDSAVALLEKKTCYKVTAEEETADAVLELHSEIHSRTSTTGGMLEFWLSGATVTAQLKINKSGDLLWSAQEQEDKGRRHLSVNELKKLNQSLLGKLISQLNKAGCQGKR